MTRRLLTATVRWAAAMLIVSALAPGLLLAEQLSEASEHVLVVGEAPLIKVTHVAGSVRVVGDSSPSLSVRVVKRARGPSEVAARNALAQVAIDVKGGVGSASISIAYGSISDWEDLKALARKGTLEDVAVDYDITLPRKTTLEVSTVNGEVSLTAVEGGISVNSVSSPMVLERMAGGCKVATISGDLTVAGIAGGLAVQSVSGKVTGKVVRGSCVIDTVSGSVELALEGKLSAVTKVSSVSGSVLLWLPDPTACNLDLQSTAGAVSSELAGAIPAGPHVLQSQLGRGGPDITVRTVTGPIALKRRK